MSLPDGAEEFLDNYFGDDAEETPVEETPEETPVAEEPVEESAEEVPPEGEGGETEPVEAPAAAEASRAPNAWNELQAEAKSLGINPKGKNKADLQAAVDAEHGRVSGLRETLKARGVPEEFYAEASPTELQRMQGLIDKQHLEYQQRLQQEIQRERQRWQEWMAQQQRQPQQAPQQQHSLADLEALKEEYGENDPLYQRAVQAYQQIEQMQRQQAELQRQHQAASYQQQQAQLESQMNGYRNAIASEVQAQGLDELLTAKLGDPETPVQKLNRVINAMVALAPQYQKPDGSFPSDKEMIEVGLNAVFGSQINEIKQGKRNAAIKQQSKKRLGSPASSKPVVTDPGKDSWDPAFDEDLKRQFESYSEAVA